MKRLSLNCLMLFLIVFFLLCQAGNILRGDPVSKDNAEKAVKGWLKSRPKPFSQAVIQKVEPHMDADGNVILYAVQLSPAGLVLLSADDMVNPVIGFSPDATNFDPDEKNPLGALAMRDSTNRSIEAREKKANVEKRSLADAERFSVAKNSWQRLLAGDAVSTVSLTMLSDPRVDPLVQSKWDQSNIGGGDLEVQACFNYYSPPGPDGSLNNYPSGCVITAISQLMRYHQYPTQSVGTASFPITVDGVVEMTALLGGDGLGGPYNWNEMSLVFSYTPVSIDNCKAVGALMHDVGAAFHAYYSATATSSNFGPFAVMKDVFHYSQAHIASVFNSGGGNMIPGFTVLANSNLDAGFPLVLLIGNTTVGHMVVCDGYGYDSSFLYYHLNMGWGGDYDFWYNLPEIYSYFYFDLVRACMYNTFPTGIGEIISGRVLDDKGNPKAGITVIAQASGGRSWSAITNDRGIYSFAKVPSMTTYQIIINSTVFETKTVSAGSDKDYMGDSGNVWGVDFSIPSPKPRAPTNVSPADGATGVALSPTLVASAFTDVNTTDTHAASQWQVRTAASPSSWTLTAFDSGATAAALTNCAVSPGALVEQTGYFWRVRYEDNHGNWSEWSAPTTFQTMRQPPAIPTAVAASNGAFPDRVRVTWTGSPGASDYAVCRSTHPTTATATALTGWIDASAGTSYDDLTAEPGVIYYYWVVAAADATGASMSGFSARDSGWAGSGVPFLSNRRGSLFIVY